MEEDLVQLNPGEPEWVGSEQVSDGLDEVAKLKPVNIVLVQPMSREPGVARPGELLDTLTGEAFKEIVAVPLKVVRNRVLFPPYDPNTVSEPICRSNDGVVPSPFANQPQSAFCKNCPQAQWQNGKPSPCAEKLKLFFVAKESGLPRVITLGGLSIAVFRQALQRISETKAAYLKRNPESEPLNLRDFYFTITSEKKQGKPTYNIVIKDMKRTASPGEFNAIYEEFIGRPYVQAIENAKQKQIAAADGQVSDVIEAQFVPQEV